MRRWTPPLRPLTIIDAIKDKSLFAPWFRKPETWSSWFAFLNALFALKMTPAQQAIFTACTGRELPPATPISEAWLVCGRRAGKSFMLALVAVYLATFKSYARYLAPGERGTIVIIAADRKQARTIFRFVSGLLNGVPMLAKMIERQTSDAFDLNNAVTIEIQTASFRSTRGYTLIVALLDEVAFWRSDESANPDTEILAALRPAMVTIPNAMLLCASSPYARRGALWEAHRKHFAKDSPVLIWKAATRVMNPVVPQSAIDAAMEADPSSAAAEYGADFRVDVETFVSREVVDAATPPGVFELPPVSGLSYVGFVDPSGGSADSFTLAIAHREGNRGVLDLLRERRPPFSPDEVCAEFSEALKSYRVRKVTGDRYAAEWPVERFRVHGITYETSEKPKSALYSELLPLLNSGRVDLLDHTRLIAQLCNLERRTARGGRDSIDHPPGGHDDVANVCAGALVLAAGRPSKADSFRAWAKVRVGGSPLDVGNSAILYARSRGF